MKKTNNKTKENKMETVKKIKVVINNHIKIETFTNHNETVKEALKKICNSPEIKEATINHHKIDIKVYDFRGWRVLQIVGFDPDYLNCIIGL